MKYSIIPLLSFTCLFFILGCCSDKFCRSEVGFTIEMPNYESGNYSMLVERFEKNGQFDNLKSDVIVPVIISNSAGKRDNLRIYGDYITDNFDYRCILLQDSNSFTISNLSINRTAAQRRCRLAKTKEMLACPYSDFTIQGDRIELNGNSIILKP